MSDALYNTDRNRPGTIAAFFSGFKSGVISGVVMTAVMTALTFAGIFTLTPLMGVGMILATSFFSGIMSVLRNGDERAASPSMQQQAAIVPVITQGMGRAPQITPTLAADDAQAPARSDGKSWAETATRSETSQSRIQQILADGAMNDKSRAAAILAAREQNAAAADAGVTSR
jgi:hypothetical protein